MTITRNDLELAALAAGHMIGWGEEAPCQPHTSYIWSEDRKMSRWWRPHTDPGDAARLAVRLNMEINMDRGQVASTTRDMWGWECAAHNGTETDKLRAWCEAVVKCAAAVGERMQIAQRTSATPEQVAGSLRAVDEFDAAKKGGA